MATILLVEDNDGLAKIYCKALEADDHSVFWLTHGSAALHAIESNVPDIVILDLVLPDMNGLDVAREMRRVGYGGPMIAITGKIQPEDGDAAMFVDTLLKPFGLATLQAAVAAVVARSKEEKLL